MVENTAFVIIAFMIKIRSEDLSVVDPTIDTACFYRPLFFQKRSADLMVMFKVTGII
jgi:hypothetical protein